MGNQVVFIGPCGGGKIPTNGASIKNYYILKSFDNEGVLYKIVDTEFWKIKPYIILKLIWHILSGFNKTFIISADSHSTYKLLTILSILNYHHIIYWVIGGAIANEIKRGKYKITPYKKCKYILVEGDEMKNTLYSCGLTNVVTVPNFKNIGYIPIKKRKQEHELYSFVFLSRITPQKGCDELLQCIKLLNEKGYKQRLNLTFYGSIQESYRDNFLSQVNAIENVSYGGFLDLRIEKNYDELSNFDVMLFPTFWKGEGFPGVLIDALIAGIPVIASDWNLNKDIIVDGVTGLIVPPHNIEALANAILSIINNDVLLEKMTKSCQQYALKYDVKNVLNKQFYKNIGLK